MDRLLNFERTGSATNRLRRRRFELFVRLLAQVPRPTSVLDVGGYPGFWTAMGWVDDPSIRVTILNANPTDVQPSADLRFEGIVGDARHMPVFTDGQFDVVFSNSVIEHVGGWEDQQRMATEVKRVGSRSFVQTPYRYFPVEPHFMVPLFQFYPLRVRQWLVRNWRLGQDGYNSPDDVAAIRLLSRRDAEALFPESVIVPERVLGFTKSLMIIRGFGADVASAATPRTDHLP